MKGCEMAKKMKWEVAMYQQRELRKKGAALLYQRVVLLVTCYEDSEFRRWCEDTGKVDIDWLNDELADVGIDFMTMKRVLERFPDGDVWEVRDVRKLIAEVMESDRKERPSTEKIDWKGRALAAEKECERLRGELAAVNKTLELLGSIRAA